MKWLNRKIVDVKWFSWWSIRTENGDSDDSDGQEEVKTLNNKQKTPQKIQNPLQNKVPTKVNVKDLSSLLNSNDDSEMSQIYYQTTEALKNAMPLRPETPDSRPDTPDNRPVTPYIERTCTPFERPLTPAMRRVMSESLPIPRSGTPFTSSMNDRTQCQSLTAKGAQCRNAAVMGFSKCR